MKKIILVFYTVFCMMNSANSQIVCIFCYDQNDSISQNVNNLLLNGSFENSNCIPYPVGNPWNVWCPNASQYLCDITNWTATGGGTGTYSMLFDNSISTIPDGNVACYFGNSFCQPCSQTVDDTSCFTTVDCETTGIPPGYPQNGAAYGGATGVSIEQTVTGLMTGATYILEFWTGGEGGFLAPGLFAVDIGFGNSMLRCPSTSPGSIGRNYIIEFNATSSSHTFRFTNWGHVCGGCTELVLDNVRLYTLAELNPIVPICAGATPSAFFSAPNHLCPGTCTNFTNLSSGSTSYQWNFPGGSPSTSTDPNPQNICYNNPGQYYVELIASNGFVYDTLHLNNYINVYPYPINPVVTQVGNTLFSTGGYISYQWFFGSDSIAGATNSSYTATQNGNYNLVVADNNGCTVGVGILNVIVEGGNAVNDFTGERLKFTVFPNPAKDMLFVTCYRLYGGEVSLKIYNSIGEEIYFSEENNVNGKFSKDISLKDFADGIYVVQLKSSSAIAVNKFIIQK